MSKILVSQMLGRAQYDLNRASNEAALDPKLKAIQDAFTNSQFLVNQEGLAELCGLIIGFRPRTNRSAVQPFQVFAQTSKGETRIVKFALCIFSANNTVVGISALSESPMNYNPEICRLATEEEAEKFLQDEVSKWEDGSLCTFISQKLGAQYLPGFFTELERSVPPITKHSSK